MSPPLYALHKDASGRIINATATGYSFDLSNWFRGLDLQPGDRIEFGEKVERKALAPANIEPLALVSAEKSA